MKLAFRIALRFLSSNKGQTFLITLGIAIGISVQIFIGSLIEGLQISLLDTTIGRSSHITIAASEKNEPFNDYEAVLNQLSNQVEKMTPTLTGGAFIKTDDKTNQILLRGFDLASADQIYRFSEAVLEGGRLPAPDTNEVLMGVTLSEDYNIEIGDTLEILSPAGQLTEIKVVGFFDLEVAAINASWVVSGLDLSRTVFDFDENQVTAIESQIEEPFDSDLIATQMQTDVNREDLRFDDWKAQNEALLSGLSGQSTSSLMIQVFVVISVVLGIASVLAISVLQKSRQIGILKAMGINDRTSSLVFLFQGFLLGILGGLLGILFGLGLLVVFSKFALNPDGTPVVPIFINYRFMMLSGLIAVVSSTFASIIPALKSRKLSPIEVIKNG